MTNQLDDAPRDLQEQLAMRDQVQQQYIATKEELNRESYQLDLIEAELEIVQSELDRLESLSVTSVLSSLLGTKPGKLDAGREELEALRCQHQECEQVVQTLTESVSQIEFELAAFADVEAECKYASANQSPAHARGAHPLSAHDLQLAVDAAESLLTGLGGAFRICNKLRTGPNLASGQGALLSTAMQAWRNKNAGSVTGQLSDAVQHLREQLGRLNLGPDCLPDVFALMPRLEPFADLSTLGSKASTDAWAELEAITRNIVADLQDELRRIGA